MQASFHFDIDIAQTDDVTTAAFAPVDDHPNLGIVGSAKRHPKDENMPVIGIQLALARLFQKLGDEYQRSVDALVQYNCSEHYPDTGVAFKTEDLKAAVDRFEEAFRK